MIFSLVLQALSPACSLFTGKEFPKSSCADTTKGIVNYKVGKEHVSRAGLKTGSHWLGRQRNKL